MEKKAKVKLGEELVNAVEVDFRALKEDWNEYQTADGSKIKMKTVVTNIARTEKFDADGNPVYVVKHTAVMAVSAPEELKGSKGVH